MKKREQINDMLFNVLKRIGEVGQSDDVPALLTKITQLYGLKTVAYLGTNIQGLTEKEPHLAVTYSPAWIDHYKVHRYVEIDPVIQLGLKRLLPIDWQEFGRPQGAIRRLFGEAVEFGLGRNGLSVPIHGANGERALLTVTSDVSDREWQQQRCFYMRDFQVLASHVHQMVLRAEGVSQKPIHLTPRERQCLWWTSEGKRVWECATILSLSPHTVRGYLASIRYKLNVTSNTHAVSKAAKLGLLMPGL